jgi:molybdate transport system substrate-binding protein
VKSWKLRLLAAVLTTSAIMVAVVLWAQWPSRQPKTLRVLCGSSMADPGREVAETLRKDLDTEVELDLGGSETLLPKVLADAPADVFICHDPFEEKVKQANRLAGSVVVGRLRPVLLVRPGNPKSIASLQDLSRADVKLGIGDPRYSTCGEIFVQALDARGLREAVEKQIEFRGRTHAEIVQGLLVGPLDAVVVWNYIATLYKGKVQVVKLNEPFRDVRITILGLSQSPSPQLRDSFLQGCRGEKVRQVFASHGYDPAE